MSFTAPKIADIHGHLRVMDELSEGMLARPELMREFGEELFWASWTAIRRAEAFGVEWVRIRPLAKRLPKVVKHASSDCQRSRIATMVRLLGTRISTRLYQLFRGSDDAIHT